MAALTLRQLCNISEGIARVERDELRARMSLIGPQRDDVGFTLEGTTSGLWLQGATLQCC